MATQSPTLNDLGAAIQHPSHAFRDQVLSSCSPELTPLGLPKPRSGGFAVTYKLIPSKGDAYAVRCFHRRVDDLEQRYADISRYLGQSRQPFLSLFEYQREGIRVGNEWHPLVKMPWVSGTTLASYVEQIRKRPILIRKLSEHIRSIALQLEKLGISHGDLQHGNILASESGVSLIDYDGMFVPKMRATTASDSGHVNFQSPLRTSSDFGPRIDRFSTVVITFALKALELDSTLWDRYSTGENLLFVRKDFISPAQSPLLDELSAFPGLAQYVSTFRHVCGLPLEFLPTLEEFLSGASFANVTVPANLIRQPHSRLHQYEIISALDRSVLQSKSGEVVQIVGKVVGTVRQTAINRQPYVFVDFADWRQLNFRLVVWSDQIKPLEDQVGPLQQLHDSWVTITGLVTMYGEKPQIVVDDPSALRIVQGGEIEAKQLLDEGAADRNVPLLPLERRSSSSSGDSNQSATVPANSPSSTTPLQRTRSLDDAVKASDPGRVVQSPKTRPSQSNVPPATPQSKSSNQKILEEIQKSGTTAQISRNTRASRDSLTRQVRQGWQSQPTSSTTNSGDSKHTVKTPAPIVTQGSSNFPNEPGRRYGGANRSHSASVPSTNSPPLTPIVLSGTEKKRLSFAKKMTMVTLAMFAFLVVIILIGY